MILWPIHNVAPGAEGSLLTLDTGAGALCVLGPDGAPAASLTLAPPAPHGFLRGLCPAAGRLLVGDRNRLLVVDLSAGRIARALTLSRSVREAVYAIAPLPPGFEQLPASLAAA